MAVGRVASLCILHIDFQGEADAGGAVTSVGLARPLTLAWTTLSPWHILRVRGGVGRGAWALGLMFAVPWLVPELVAVVAVAVMAVAAVAVLVGRRSLAGWLAVWGSSKGGASVRVGVGGCSAGLFPGCGLPRCLHGLYLVFHPHLVPVRGWWEVMFVFGVQGVVLGCVQGWGSGCKVWLVARISACVFTV